MGFGERSNGEVMSDSSELKRAKRLFGEFWVDEQEPEVQKDFSMFGSVGYEGSSMYIQDHPSRALAVFAVVDSPEKAEMVMKRIHELLEEVG